MANKILTEKNLSVPVQLTMSLSSFVQKTLKTTAFTNNVNVDTGCPDDL